MGSPLPCSILTEQDRWVTRTTLMTHQDAAVTKMLPSKVGGLFMEMGTGKTRTTIELAHLRQAKIDRVIWFCPVSVKATIEYEILKHTNCTPADIYVFDQKTTEARIPSHTRWIIVGIESMSSSARQIHAADALITERTMVVCDESTYIKGHYSKRTQRMTLIARKARYRLILTGTPFTQGPVDLFAQMRFLSPEILGYKSFYSFATNHLVYSKRHKGQIVGSLDVRYLADRMAPYIYQVTKKECLDLPEKYYDSHYFTLSGEQLEAYEQAKLDFADDLLAYLDDDGEETGIAIFRLFSRLQSIVCGFDGESRFAHARVDALLHAVQSLPDTHKHVVIWAKFRSSVQEIAAALTADGRRAVIFDGTLNETQRSLALTDWKANGGHLVATQSIGGHGIDLTEASAVIFYANGFKYSERIQAEDRCHRIGQDRDVLYVSLYARCGIEDKIEAAIAAKEDVLTRFRREIELIKDNKQSRAKSLLAAL